MFCCSVIAWHIGKSCLPPSLHGPVFKMLCSKDRFTDCIVEEVFGKKTFKKMIYWLLFIVLSFPLSICFHFLLYPHLSFPLLIYQLLAKSHCPTSKHFLPSVLILCLPFLSFPLLLLSLGLWARAALTPTCWTCRAAPIRSEYVAVHFSMRRSCTRMHRWQERWSNTCPTWQWRQTRRSTRSCPCSVSRPTAPVSREQRAQTLLLTYSSLSRIFLNAHIDR